MLHNITWLLIVSKKEEKEVAYGGLGSTVDMKLLSQAFPVISLIIMYQIIIH